jgi:ABC-type multidrug transport system ATPase subunit
MAIMGPSGSGKSSLLDILSGRKTVGNVSGGLYLNGLAVTGKQIRLSQAYVAQEDVLIPTLTVRETLQYVADLQIPREACPSRAHRSAQVQGVIEVLQLLECADTKVGGGFARGISGGQKRRVSIGIEFLTSPRILFMDGERVCGSE